MAPPCRNGCICAADQADGWADCFASAAARQRLNLRWLPHPFFALLLASIETSLVFFAQQTLESAAEMTGRELLTGKAQSDGLTQQQFKTLACSKLPIFMKCANLSVDVTVAPSFAAANTSRPVLTYDVNGNPTNGWQFQSGNPGDILVLKLVYLWPLPTGPLGFNLSDASGSRRLMLATSVFKTEPYVS